MAVPLGLARVDRHGGATRTPLRKRPNNEMWFGRESFGTSEVVVFASTRRVRTWDETVPTLELPWWYRHSADGVSEEEKRRTDNYWVEAFGWPMRSMARTLYGTTSGWSQRTGSRERDMSFYGPGVTGDGWPREVLWVGMVVDGALYAAALVIPVGVFVFARGRWRRLRGECVGCGYSLGGLG